MPTPLPAIGSSAPALRRDNGDEMSAILVSEEERQAQRAELLCDIPALCRLKRSAPEVVTEARVRSLVHRCRPDVSGVLLSGDPCLSAAILLSPSVLAGEPTQTTQPARKRMNSAGAMSDGKRACRPFSAADLVSP